jgi:hypothetical protein
VKVCFGADVRRIQLNEPVSFDELSATVANRFSKSCDQFRLTYTDPEGDACVITSTDELDEAFRLTPSLRLKGYDIRADGTVQLDEPSSFSDFSDFVESDDNSAGSRTPKSEPEFLEKPQIDQIDQPQPNPGNCERFVQTVEVGPLWNHDHAVAVAAKLTEQCPDIWWTGQWWTTIAGKMSVVQLDMPVGHELPCMSNFSLHPTFAAHLHSNTETDDQLRPVDIEVGPLFDAINTAPVRLAACKTSRHSDNLVVAEDSQSALGKPSLCYMEGAEGFMAWNVAPQKISSPAAKIIISFAAADPRPLKVLIDGVVVTEICDGTTGGWDENDTQWVAHVPFPYDWSVEHEIMLEGASFFPHVAELVLVPCEMPAAAETITALVDALGSVVSSTDRDVSKALCLIDVLRKTADELAGSLVALHHKNESVKRAANRVIHETQTCLPEVQQKPSSKAEGPEHRGVCCDGCGMHPIVGVRYKCMNCPDFDLCEGCEAQGVHDHHVFLKLKQPLKVVHQATWTTDDGQDVMAGEASGPMPPEAPTPARIEAPAPAEVVPAEVPASAVPVPESVPTPVPLDAGIPSTFQASFVKDVTIDDGTVIRQGQKFTKVWRLQNTGSNTWPANIELQPVGAQPFPCEFNGSSGIPVPSIAPGEMVDVSVDMTTPLDKVGDLTMYFRLVNGAGQQSAHHFWVTVHVMPAPVPAPAPDLVQARRCEPRDIEHLRNMGFWDDEQNAKALAESNYDVAAAVDWLLQQHS